MTCTLQEKTELGSVLAGFEEVASGHSGTLASSKPCLEPSGLVHDRQRCGG